MLLAKENEREQILNELKSYQLRDPKHSGMSSKMVQEKGKRVIGIL